MNDERTNHDNDDMTWVEKIANAFSGDVKNRKDLLSILAVANRNEVIDEDAMGIIEGALKVSDMQVRDIMIQRVHMQVVKADSTMEEFLPQIVESGHSRYPVIGENPDDILGILLVKDLLPDILKANHSSFDFAGILRPTTVVPESKRLNVLLQEFRENRNHMAIVIDEYGGVAGLVTIEDVLEEIVGEIEDETDAESDSFYRKVGEGEYLVNALTPIDEFNETFNAKFSDDEFDTIGGLVIHSFGYLPSNNESTSIDGFDFEVLKSDQRKIHTLSMRRSSQAES
ncbi:MAG: magnesium and cobalt transporter [Halieaceae bacterium]|jgi:magnesium and cobalt transporter